MLPEQKIAADYSDHQHRQPVWNQKLVGEIISFVTPTFEKRKPLKVYAGIVRYETFDYMDIKVFPRNHIMEDDLAFLNLEADWEEQRSEDIDVHIFALTHAAKNPDKPDWDELLTDFGNRGTRYTQIYPPLPGDE